MILVKNLRPYFLVRGARQESNFAKIRRWAEFGLVWKLTEA